MLAERVEEETARLLGVAGVGEEELVPVTQPTQDACFVSGSIVALDASGKLGAEGGLGLEGSAGLSDARIVPVDTTLLTHFSFFPGQVALLKGRNPSGRLFMAQEQLHAKSGPFAPIGSKPADLGSH